MSTQDSGITQEVILFLDACIHAPQLHIVNKWANQSYIGIICTLAWVYITLIYDTFVVSKLGNINRSDVKVTFCLYGHLDVYSSFIPNKLYLVVLLYESDFKTPCALWSPLSKVVSSKFHGSGRHSKRNCLQDRVNFHRSRAWQIVLFLTLTVCSSVRPQWSFVFDILITEFRTPR